jgi:hypothetical protein
MTSPQKRAFETGLNMQNGDAHAGTAVFEY